jgi:D-beta-D-heptose 7-phosphate kinase/D-beta-D-heptose 1-phosphate adenosyltransferase
VRDLVKRFLADTKPVRIGVLGDFLIDEHYQAEVTRIAPEAPVPVMRSTTAPPRRLPGGAGNLARQLCGLAAQGVSVRLMAPVDAPALACATPDLPADFFAACVRLGSERVPVKRRWYQDDRLLFRHDVQDAEYGSRDAQWIRRALVECCREFLRDGADLLLLSDYAGGALDREVIREVIALCKRYGVPVLVDPKRRPFHEWLGAAALKLNVSELNGHSVNQIRTLTDCACVVVTRGEKAPIVHSDAESSGPCRSLPALREPVSVSGAGDCFFAHFAAAVAKGFSWQEVASIGHVAGQVYVYGRHNMPVDGQDLLAAIDPYAAKIVGTAQAKLLLPSEWKVVFTCGCFDVALHSGHLRTLQWAREQGDVLVVAVNDDEGVRTLKGEGRPIDSWQERAERLTHLSAVGLVVRLCGTDPSDLIRELRPSLFVKGFDSARWEIPGRDIVPFALAPEAGGRHSSDLLRLPL